MESPFFLFLPLDLFDNPTLAYENGDEIGIFIYKSGGLSNRSIIQDLLKSVKNIGTFMIEYRTFLRDERLEKYNPIDYNANVIS